MNFSNLLTKKRTFKNWKNISSSNDNIEFDGDDLLSRTDLTKLVKVPEGIDENEWIVTKLVLFFKEISMIHSSISAYCTPISCPSMMAGPKYEYYWCDESISKKPIKVTAQEYVSHLKKWTMNFLQDPKIIPNDEAADFAPNFRTLVKNVFKRWFRVYAHIYHSHFDTVEDLKLKCHMNSSFRHYIKFCNEFSLIHDREFGPMTRLINEWA